MPPFFFAPNHFTKLEFIEENGLPHQSADWFAMTVVFDTFCPIFSAANHQVSMSLRGGLKGRRGNPHPYKLQFNRLDIPRFCAIIISDRKTNKSSGGRMHPAESGLGSPYP